MPLNFQKGFTVVLALTSLTASPMAATLLLALLLGLLSPASLALFTPQGPLLGLQVPPSHR